VIDQVDITGLLVRGIIGINDSEREKPQSIRINITLFADQSKAGKSDDVQDCINYRTVTKKVIAQPETARRFTVEALAANLARLCLEVAELVKVSMRVEKPAAVRFDKTVGIVFERSKEDL
jgi:FolB domain-containing protein